MHYFSIGSMKMKTRLGKGLLALIALLLLLPLPAIRAATEGNSSGSAAVSNAAPTISSPTFTDTASVSKNATLIDVSTEYWISCTIADSNKLTDLSVVTYKIWGPSSTEAGADAESTHYTFTYTQSTDVWALTGPAGAWLVSASCQDPADQSAGSGTFRLAFKLSKVAEHTDTATWPIKITVTDDSAASGTNTQLTFGINFYTEITVVDASHGWTGLTPGQSDQALTSPADAKIDLTVTANGVFNLQAKGSGALTSGTETIPLGNVKIHATTLASATALTTSYVNIGGLTAQAAGASLAKSFKPWLTVPSPCEDGTYTYTLYVQSVHG